MKNTMFQQFMNYLLGFIVNNGNFFGFTNFAPFRTESEGAFFSSVVFIPGDGLTPDGFPQAAFTRRIKKLAGFFRRFFTFFAKKDLNMKFFVTFVLENSRASDGEATSKFENFVQNFFNQPGFESFEFSVVHLDEFFGGSSVFDFSARDKFGAFDLNAEFPFDQFDFSKEFSFMFFEANQEKFAFPFFNQFVPEAAH